MNETIGEDKVSIPGYYYKVAYQPSANRMISFLLPNEPSDKDLSLFVVPVDSIETVPGIDFFSQLEDTTENRLESASGSIQDFSTNASGSVHIVVTVGKPSNTVHCKDIAKSTGKRV